MVWDFRKNFEWDCCSKLKSPRFIIPSLITIEKGHNFSENMLWKYYVMMRCPLCDENHLVLEIDENDMGKLSISESYEVSKNV